MSTSNNNAKRNAQPKDKANKSSLPDQTGSTTRKHLLTTQTVWLIREDIRIRYAELGDPSKPTVLLLHGVPENLQAWYAVAPLAA